MQIKHSGMNKVCSSINKWCDDCLLILADITKPHAYLPIDKCHLIGVILKRNGISSSVDRRATHINLFLPSFLVIIFWKKILQREKNRARAWCF